MKARDLLKWKRALNEIKFKHEELELVKEICDSHASEFQIFLEEYCSSGPEFPPQKYREGPIKSADILLILDYRTLKWIDKEQNSRQRTHKTRSRGVRMPV